MGPSLFIYIEINVFTKLWLFTMPSEHGLYTMAPTTGFFQYKEIQIYNEVVSFWMALPSQRRSWILGNAFLGEEFWLLATNFICTRLHDGAISVFMHALARFETLKD